MSTFVIVAMVIAMLGVVGALVAGLVNMARTPTDGTPEDAENVARAKTSNKLMWTRVYLQAAALALFALALVLMKG